MFNVGGGEVIIILLVALIVLGPTKLPEVARQVGRAAQTLRSISSGFQDEMKRAMDDPIEAMARERGNNVTASEEAAAPADQAEQASEQVETPDDPAEAPEAESDAPADQTEDQGRVKLDTPSGTADPTVSTAAAAGMFSIASDSEPDESSTQDGPTEVASADVPEGQQAHGGSDLPEFPVL